MDLQTLLTAIDQLPPDELETVYQHVEQRRHTVKWWVVPPENLKQLAEIMQPVQEDAAQMPEEEINALIDDAIAEVRRERREAREKHQGSH